MNEFALKEIVQACRERGVAHSPALPQPTAEGLESAVLELAKRCGFDLRPSPDAEMIMIRGYSVLVSVSATFANERHAFADFVKLQREQATSSTSVLAWCEPAAECDPAEPWLWLGNVGERRRALPPEDKLGPGEIRLPRLRAYETRKTFEITLRIPEPFTAESILDALADELEPLGWGPVDFGRGAVAKEDQAEVQARLASRSLLGKPLY